MVQQVAIPSQLGSGRRQGQDRNAANARNSPPEGFATARHQGPHEWKLLKTTMEFKRKLNLAQHHHKGKLKAGYNPKTLRLAKSHLINTENARCWNLSGVHFTLYVLAIVLMVFYFFASIGAGMTYYLMRTKSAVLWMIFLSASVFLRLINSVILMAGVVKKCTCWIPFFIGLSVISFFLLIVGVAMVHPFSLLATTLIFGADILLFHILREASREFCVKQLLEQERQRRSRFHQQVTQSLPQTSTVLENDGVPSDDDDESFMESEDLDSDARVSGQENQTPRLPQDA